MGDWEGERYKKPRQTKKVSLMILNSNPDANNDDDILFSVTLSVLERGEPEV